MNTVILKGNLVRDPEQKEVTANGRTTSVVNFTIAVSRFFKKANGERDKDTTFIPCEAWDSGAETIAKYLKKGDPVLLSGSLKMDTWEQEVDGEKVKRNRMKVRVDRFDKLNRASGTDEEVPSDEVQPEPVPASAGPDGPDDDIPF